MNMSHEEHESGIAFLGTVITEQSDAPWLIKPKVNDSDVLFKVDTRAGVTVVSEELYKEENFGKLQKISKMLLGPGQDSLQVNGLLLKGCRLLIPKSLQSDILEKRHTTHQGIAKLRERAKKSVWGTGLSVELQQKVEKCDIVRPGN